MSAWTHAACLSCYGVLHPGRQPSRVVEDDPGTLCCRCGGRAGDGIYVRADPSQMLCQGFHMSDAADGEQEPAREPIEQEWDAWKAAVEAWQADPANAPQHEPWQMCDCPLPPQQPWNGRVSGHCAAVGPVATWAELQERRT